MAPSLLPSIRSTSQSTKVTLPAAADECTQCLPLTLSAPSLRSISLQEPAGKSGIEPRGTGEEDNHSINSNLFGATFVHIFTIPKNSTSGMGR